MKSAQKLRMRSRRGEGGQTMPLVLGIILVLSLGTVVLVQNTFQQFPIVSKDVVQHQAYRAMVSGLDEYQYAVNANPDFAACNASFFTPPATTQASTLTGAASVCQALTFGSWIPVPGSGAANGPPAWYLIDNPVINTSTGNLSINIVGAAGYANDYNYQSAVVTLQPLNGFLLNVLWINYDQVDPAVVNQYGNNGTPTCNYFWYPNPNALGNNCEILDFISADSLTGNLFVNDTVFVCGSPSFQNVETADPTEMYVEDNGCSGTPSISGTQQDNVGVQPIPTDNSSLATQASTNGCLYEGPTTIVINGSNMTVTSPATPTGPPSGAPGTSSSNDALNAAANVKNSCLPISPATTVPVPANGVIYVETCQTITTPPTKCNGQTYNPLANAGETGTGGDTAGDAIVQGTVNSPMTIGSANNIVIDGDICYADVPLVSGQCTTAPAAPSTDVLGLVADNYVEINHPVSNGNNVTSCPSTVGSGAVTCDLNSPYIDAAILALSHSFLVNNYTSGSSLGTLTMYGTIDQDWRGPVGTFNGGGTIATGYAKNYQYDPRLVYLSPPYYLNPGTSQWGFSAFTVDAGRCQLASGSPNTAACTGYP